MNRPTRIVHMTVLTLAVVAVLGAIVSQPTADAVRLFGFEVPTVCTIRRLTGWSCPGCGMTRSFAFLAHGDLRSALAINPLGPFVFAVIAAQIPYRVARLVKGIRRSS